jgi:hypothetical protein
MVLNHYMKRVITAQDVPAGGELRVPVGTIVTSSAREVAAVRGVRILSARGSMSALAPPDRTVAIGSDHGGYRPQGGAQACSRAWAWKRATSA